MCSLARLALRRPGFSTSHCITQTQSHCTKMSLTRMGVGGRHLSGRQWLHHSPAVYLTNLVRVLARLSPWNTPFILPVLLTPHPKNSGITLLPKFTAAPLHSSQHFRRGQQQPLMALHACRPAPPSTLLSYCTSTTQSIPGQSLVSNPPLTVHRLCIRARPEHDPSDGLSAQSPALFCCLPIFTPYNPTWWLISPPPFAGSPGCQLLSTLQQLRSCPGLSPVGMEWLLPSQLLQHLGSVLFCPYLLSRGPSQVRNRPCFMNLDS